MYIDTDAIYDMWTMLSVYILGEWHIVVYWHGCYIWYVNNAIGVYSWSGPESSESFGSESESLCGGGGL